MKTGGDLPGRGGCRLSFVHGRRVLAGFWPGLGWFLVGLWLEPVVIGKTDRTGAAVENGMDVRLPPDWNLSIGTLGRAGFRGGSHRVGVSSGRNFSCGRVRR